MVNRPILPRAEHAESPCRSVETMVKEDAGQRYAKAVLSRIFLSTCTCVLIAGRPNIRARALRLSKYFPVLTLNL